LNSANLGREFVIGLKPSQRQNAKGKSSEKGGADDGHFGSRKLEKNPKEHFRRVFGISPLSAMRRRPVFNFSIFSTSSTTFAF
jgi:hypothetical protein